MSDLIHRYPSSTCWILAMTILAIVFEAVRGCS